MDSKSGEQAKDAAGAGGPGTEQILILALRHFCHRRGNHPRRLD